MEIFEDHARFDDRELRLLVDRAQPVHAPQAEKELRSAAVRGRAADHAAVAALRDKCGILLSAEANDGGDLPGRRRRQHRGGAAVIFAAPVRSEEHTSELQSLMRISYAVLCLQKKKKKTK